MMKSNLKSLILKTILFKITCALPVSIVPPDFTHCANSGGVCYCNGLVFVGLPELNQWYGEPIYSYNSINCTTDVGKCWCMNDDTSIAPQYNEIETGIKLWKEYNTTLFNSFQSFNVLNIDTSIRKLTIAYTQDKLISTQDLATSIDGLAAVNGGFHAYGKNIGSITKLRVNGIDIVGNNTVTEWDLTNENVKGVLTIDSNGLVDIGDSNDVDNWVGAYTFIHSGPLLLLNGIVQPLENTKWNNVRNPRTSVCISYDSNSVKMITVDGRFYTSAGMTLPEFQNFLKSLGCKSAINLDGGGSTTMYLKNMGVINEPRDKPPPGVAGFNSETIVRRISNAIVVV